MNKNGQTGGLITGLVFGVASLVIVVLIAFVIVNTLNTGGLFDDGRVTNTVTNQTTTGIGRTGVVVTAGGFPQFVEGRFALTDGWDTNATGTEINILNNLSIDAIGNVTNSSGITTAFDADGQFGTNATVSYTYLNYTIEEIANNRLAGNFSQGVDNISEQIPTVLLIAAIILILAILAILVGVWARMRMGGGAGSEL